MNSNPNPRVIVENLAREMLQALAACPGAPPLSVADADHGLACLIQVWNSGLVMPTATGERRKRVTGGRVQCRVDVIEVVRVAGGAVTRKEIVRALKLAGKKHGPGTVAKALADLTAAGELVNPKDKKGYRPAGWRRSQTPSLFD